MSVTKRNKTPPEVAEKYRVSTAKVICWIRTGELAALNLAHRGCSRPRYSISPDAIEAFERSRQVVPDGGLSATQRLRRRARQGGVKDFFEYKNRAATQTAKPGDDP